jgi:hypothetical protein
VWLMIDLCRFPIGLSDCALTVITGIWGHGKVKIPLFSQQASTDPTRQKHFLPGSWARAAYYQEQEHFRHHQTECTELVQLP